MEKIEGVVLGVIIATGFALAVGGVLLSSQERNPHTNTGMKAEALDHEGHEYTVFTHRESLQIQVLHNQDCKKCKP